MKVWSMFTRALALAFLSCIVASGVKAQEIKVDKNNRTIAVTATDSAESMADTALVHIGFVVYAPDAKTAYAEGSKTSNAIVKTLMDAGISKTDLQSESQNIAETQPYDLEKLPPMERAQKKLQVRQNWTVKAKADDAARILNLAINAGANQSGQIDWTVSDENALDAKAAGKALARARQIAAQMAQGLGIRLGDLIYASNQAPEPTPRPMMMRAMAAAPPPPPPPPTEPLAISPQRVERSATVYAVFSIE